ncbi:MAG: DNA polymerase Y family protein [Burkholderiaceae bacterium]
MLWIAVCLPELPLETCAAGDAPFAIGDAQRILHVNRAAAAAGVEAGMRRATAAALCPRLVLRARDPAKERAALEAVARWALRFTPNVALVAPPRDPRIEEAPAGVLLEVAASLRLFGGRTRLLAALRKGLIEQGHAARMATAPVPHAAWLLARAADGLQVRSVADLPRALAPLPVWLLGPGRVHREALRGVGIARIGDLLPLPRAAVARRFSEALLDELDRALGEKADPRAWFVAPERFEARLELAARVDGAEALLFAARRLIVQMSGWLAGRCAASRTLVFDLIHEGRAPTVLPLRLASASNDDARFTAVLREALGKLRLVAPVYELQLRCDDIVAATPLAGELFPAGATEQEGLAQLIERLQARLGREQVVRLRPHADHRPEFAFRADAVDATAARVQPALFAPSRPLWLLPAPVALGERDHAPSCATPLTLVAGPERIESGWWDGRWVERDYFVARDAGGALLWIFRPRAPDPVLRQGWYLHGRFA